MAEYAFLTAWRVAAPREAVFEVLHASERWPEWWDGVESVRKLEDGGATAVLFEWRVHTTRWWMNAFAPIARPVFRWNHDRLMRAGGRGLAQRLGVELLSGA